MTDFEAGKFMIPISVQQFLKQIRIHDHVLALHSQISRKHAGKISILQPETEA